MWTTLPPWVTVNSICGQESLLKNPAPLEKMIGSSIAFRYLVFTECSETIKEIRMYGMVIRAIGQVVITDLGENAGEVVKVSAGGEVDIFISDIAYPDHLTFALLAAVSERLVPPSPNLCGSSESTGS